MIINQIHIHSILIDVNLLFWILHFIWITLKRRKRDRERDFGGTLTPELNFQTRTIDSFESELVIS